jgi:alkylation response protein AidB-like acyl-CoA dehydrogenase
MQLEMSSVLIIARELQKIFSEKNPHTQSEQAAVKLLFDQNEDLRNTDPKALIEEMTSSVARAFDVYNGNVGINLLALKKAPSEEQHWYHYRIISDALSLLSLYLYGTDAQKQRYMPRLATGELIAAFALTEPGAGSDVAGIKMRAERSKS